MKTWTLLDRATTPSGAPLELLSRRDDFLIRVRDQVLMTSRSNGSERALAELALAHLAHVQHARVLIAGLGCGFTLATALRLLEQTAAITVVELVPAVVRWNRDWFTKLTDGALNDDRVRIIEGDVVRVLQTDRARFDAILLDVDNGPSALTEPSNAWLYSRAGLLRIASALTKGGSLALWSAGPDALFKDNLRSCAFQVTEHIVPSNANRGRRHLILIGRKE